MSEEKKCHKKLIVIGVILSLVLSFTSLCISSFLLLAATGKITVLMGNNAPISKKYDKGRSLEKALKKDKAVIVWFYVDWCGYCQKFAPTFDKVIKDKRIKKNFTPAFINCDLPENRKYIEEYGVKGFPTVYLLNPKTGKKLEVSNFKLFAPDAKEIIIKDSEEFLK